MRTYTYLLLIVILYSCNDLSFDERLTLPVVEMLEATAIDETGVTLNALVHDLGNENVVRGSFNWFPKGKKYFVEQERLLIDVNLNEHQTISARVDHDLIDDEIYIGRFIIELENEKIYSDTIQFTSKGATWEPFKKEILSAIGPLNSAEFCFWAQDEIFITGGDRPGDPLFIYNIEEEKGWQPVSNIPPTRLFGQYLMSYNNKIYSAGHSLYSSAEHAGLWVTDNVENDFTRLGDIPIAAYNAKFRFEVNGIGYMSSRGTSGGFWRFDLEDYQGVTDIGPLPFEGGAYQYYSFVCNDLAYVFFSEPVDNADQFPFYNNQLWVFDPETLFWEQLADYPGVGRDFFTTATDHQRYLYVGMGAPGHVNTSTTDPRSIDDDFWRYDVTNNSWEFIGYGLYSVNLLTYDAGIKNGKHYFMLGSMMSISPDEIKPID